MHKGSWGLAGSPPGAAAAAAGMEALVMGGRAFILLEPCK